MPKKLTFIEIFSTCLFAMVLQQVVDLALDLKLDLYGYFTKGIQWRYLIPIFGIYPAVNAIFLNYYQYMKNFTQKFMYLMGCSIFSVVYEALAIKSGYFYHHHWELWYSAIAYPLLFVFLLLVLKWVRRMIQYQYDRVT
ncbi:CBO0543 family protein [Cytobacillus gottheilii]